MAEPLPAPPRPRRITIDERRFYELTVFDPLGVALYISEANHDATLQLTPLQIVELRAELASALIVLGHGAPQTPGLHSAEAMAIARQLSDVFLALVELDKRHPDEVDALCTTVVSHLRSWRPFVLARNAP